MQDVWKEIMASLADRGYTASWLVLGAKHAGAPMERLRWFLYANRDGIAGQSVGSVASHPLPVGHWNEFGAMPNAEEWRRS